jgi:hypothetical protein
MWLQTIQALVGAGETAQLSVSTSKQVFRPRNHPPGDVMKIARLLLAVVSLSLAAACTADVTAPSTARHADYVPSNPDTTAWQGGTGSGG